MNNRRTIKQLKVLMKVAKHEEDMASKALKDAQGALLLARRTLDQLGQYALQYHQQLIDKTTKQSQSALSWQQNTQFLASLDHTKRLQVQKIAEEERNVQFKRRNWMGFHLNRKKIEILLQKQEDMLDEKLSKDAQKELDDLINQYHSRQTE